MGQARASPSIQTWKPTCAVMEGGTPLVSIHCAHMSVVPHMSVPLYFTSLLYLRNSQHVGTLCIAWCTMHQEASVAACALVSTANFALCPCAPPASSLLAAGSMLAALNSRMLQYCMHDKGVYVAQTAANCASNAELVEMAQVGHRGC